MGVLAWRYHDLGAPEGSSSFLGGGRLSKASGKAKARESQTNKAPRPVMVRSC